MNKANLKRYAPQARKDFIAAVTARAQLLGLSADTHGQPLAEPCTVQGDVALIQGRPWPARVAGQRDLLLARMQRQGYAATLEAVAYTWFNRLAALRYMELHDYLGHGRRVLSAAEGGTLPEVLAHALDLAEADELPGLRPDTVRELKLANQDGELYRRVLLAQCNALHQAMPFLFEAIDDETELLLPDNLLLSDAIVAKLVAEVPEADWAEVEAIGWLYQFYISEKKDEVIGKVVKSEDIPAATQLFTPNWIVQYLVQNSVGRLWLMANPQSQLASQWPYYIQPAEQTPEVQAQLDALIQTRIAEDGDTLNPETLTVLDPACGSGHILVVAYDVLKAIYLERGYQPRAIPRLILEKNLYGLDIDDRAAQLAAFALLMKARADDRRLFNDPPKLNVLSLQESKGLDADELAAHLAPFGLQRAPLKALVDTFEHAKTFGSLIQIPAGLNGELAAMTAGLQQALRDGDLYAQQAAKDVLPLVWQGLVLGMQFDAVVANPPYMGGKYMDNLAKKFVNKNYLTARADLFACFLQRGCELVKSSGFFSSVTMDAWMFLSSYSGFRTNLLDNFGIHGLVHVGWNCFPEGHTYNRGVVAVLGGGAILPIGTYQNLSDVPATVDKGELFLSRREARSGSYNIDQKLFNRIPGKPIAYWVSDAIRRAFEGKSLGQIAELRAGITTGDNERFVRHWSEISFSSLKTDAISAADFWSDPSVRWAPLKSGGDFRKWFGNLEKVIRFDKEAYRALKVVGNHCASEERYFVPGLTWSDIGSTKQFGVRYAGPGCIFSTVGHSLFCEEKLIPAVASYLCSSVASYLIMLINPTIHANPGDVAKLPLVNDDDLVSAATKTYEECKKISQADWNSQERSWGFQANALVQVGRFESAKSMKIGLCHSRLVESGLELTSRMQQLEQQNNVLFASAYGIEGEITTDVPFEQISLFCNPAYIFGGSIDKDLESRRYREYSANAVVSYAIGCMMGRYSLDEPGLIYAHAGNVGFDASRYEKKFPADADGIVPITDERWFEDDAASRVREFLRAVWGADTLEENMAWLAESLGTKGSETPDETIRRYLADKFFKDHLQTYKKRPIYWLFSSGKQGAFQALVYLHRYHEGTLARLRAEYVLSQIAKMQARQDSLAADIAAASSTAARTRLTKQLDKLKKQLQEVLAYEEQLRHHADQRIALDLDDGVKVNYGKFGNLLAEVKTVTGGSGDD